MLWGVGFQAQRNRYGKIPISVPLLPRPLTITLRAGLAPVRVTSSVVPTAPSHGASSQAASAGRFPAVTRSLFPIHSVPLSWGQTLETTSYR